MALMLRGGSVASQLRKIVKSNVELFLQSYGVTPRIAIVNLTSTPYDTKGYRDLIKGECEKVGIEYGEHVIYHYSDTSIEKTINIIDELNQDKSIHGIMPMIDIPKECAKEAHEIINRISWDKDVDCLTDMNLGKLYSIENPDYIQIAPGIVSATVYLMSMYAVEINFTHCVIIGDPNSEIVKPLASILLGKGATVTICHKKTQNMGELTSQADIVFVAAEESFYLSSEMVKDGSTIIDITGSTISQKAQKVAGCVAPVLDGVWSIVPTLLMKNTLTLARRQVKI